MMKRSYAESDLAQREHHHSKKLHELHNKLSSQKYVNECSKCGRSIYDYFEKCSAIKRLNEDIQVKQ